MASSLLASSSQDIENISKRTAQISQVFPLDERTELAKFIIRCHDWSNNYHCPVKDCGAECEYVPKMCENDDCGVVISSKWIPKHDSICPQKLIDCPRCCGDVITRRAVKLHMDNTCSLRTVQCPFYDIGCTPDLKYRDLQDHMDSCVNNHLLLSQTRIQEQQSVIIDLHKRVQALERESQQQSHILTGVVSTATAAMTAVTVAETRTLKALQTEIAKVDGKVTKTGRDSHSELVNEVVKLQRDITSLKDYNIRKEREAQQRR